MPDSPRHPDRREFLLRAGSAAASVALLPALSRAWARAGDEPGLSFLDWTEVRPGLFATDTPDLGGNCLIAKADNDVLLIDTKFPVYVRQIARDAERLAGRAITRVINTHHHLDHTGGNLEFTFHLPVIAHENAISRVRAQADANRRNVTMVSRQIAVTPDAFHAALRDDANDFLSQITKYTEDAWTPTVTLATGVTGLDLGGRWLEIHHFGRPSHTDNDLVIHFPEDNVVHAGDLVFNKLNPYFDINGGVSAQGWLKSLNDLLALCDDSTVVVPGHGPITNIDGVRAQISYLQQLWDTVLAAVEKGRPLEKLKTRIWPFMEGLGLEQARPLAIEAVYLEIKANQP
ncbi:MAG: MBL fold metallo-hydrolase [Phycisphaeraceae bacterium]|nr:MAG: MBL fold metallo-hydrolase [Phycisphaeraceae bacterium]